MELKCVLQWRVSILFIVLGVGLLAPVLVQAAVTARIGEVWLADEAHAAPFHDAFAEGLRELGYVEGKNLTLFTRYANGDESRLPRLIRELLDLKIDLLFVSQAAIGPAMKATTTVPIVCATMNDPVGAGQVVSLSRPGRNLTGLSWQSVDTATKRFELARELRPKLSTMALLFDKGDRTGQIEAQVVERSCQKSEGHGDPLRSADITRASSRVRCNGE
jgi:putative ABC transport system substrate-binding protein